MKERPILFSGAMVRALLAGTKTQTRRAMRKQFRNDAEVEEMCATNERGHQVTGHSGLWWDATRGDPDATARCPYGARGDRLWVREAWRTVAGADGIAPRDLMNVEAFTHYEADEAKPEGTGKLRPGMFMPRWASRITLEVTGVRVERLQDISEEDAVAEGVARDCGLWKHYGCVTQGWIHARNSYQTLWDSVNGAGSWDANPWVWVVAFRRL